MEEVAFYFNVRAPL